MNNFYDNTLTPGNRPTWRNAYQIRAAALEHEKRRFQMVHEFMPLVKPQVMAMEKQPSGWMMLLKAPLRLLSILIG